MAYTNPPFTSTHFGSIPLTFNTNIPENTIFLMPSGTTLSTEPGRIIRWDPVHGVVDPDLLMDIGL